MSFEKIVRIRPAYDRRSEGYGICEQLLAKAVSRFRDAYKAALQHLIATCEVRLKDVDTDINGYIDMGSNGWGNGAFKFPTFENPIR